MPMVYKMNVNVTCIYYILDEGFISHTHYANPNAFMIMALELDVFVIFRVDETTIYLIKLKLDMI